jgi:hypothetical protein
VPYGRIPRPLRWGGTLGLLPVPGPFDDIVLLGAGGILWLFYRDQLAVRMAKGGCGGVRHAVGRLVVTTRRASAGDRRDG